MRLFNNPTRAGSVVSRGRALLHSGLLATLLLSASPALLSCTTESAKNRFIIAEKLWSDGNYAAAVNEFEKVARKDPKGKLGQQALYRAAMTQALYLGEFSEAIQKFRTFAELTPQEELAWDAQKQIGDILFGRTEQYDQAVTHYRRMLKQRPNAEEAPELLYRIARSQFFTRQFSEAIGTYEEIANRFPESSWAEKARFQIGVSWFTQGEQSPGESSSQQSPYRKAIASYEKFVEKHPQSPLVPEAKFGIASCLEELDELDAAYKAYEELQSTYPSPNVIQIKLIRIRERKAQKSRN